jgi:hypothetical protein
MHSGPGMVIVPVQARFDPRLGHLDFAAVSGGAITRAWPRAEEPKAGQRGRLGFGISDYIPPPRESPPTVRPPLPEPPDIETCGSVLTRKRSYAARASGRDEDELPDDDDNGPDPATLHVHRRGLTHGAARAG